MPYDNDYFDRIESRRAENAAERKANRNQPDDRGALGLFFMDALSWPVIGLAVIIFLGIVLCYLITAWAHG